MIKVKAAGILTSIQDLGRFGHRRNGVPLSGAMDTYMSYLANELVGNTEEKAVLEMTMVGPVLEFQKATQIAITGAGFTPTVNNIEVPLNTKISIQSGDIIKFGLASYGLRGYLSVAGGFSSEVILGSQSKYYGLTKQPVLKKGDVLEINASKISKSKTTTSVKVDMSHFSTNEIEVYKGPEFEFLPKEVQEKIPSISLTVSVKSNRMAYLLTGMEAFSASEIISTPVQPGTVQLTPSGQCVVLMRDAQTTGGYARILQLSASGINELAQKRAGDSFNFRITDLP
jgi:biotin-dependent carboxylase-like uncharacterized protein